jgi:transposase
MDPVELDAFRGIVQSVRRTARRQGPAEPELREAAAVYQSADRAPTAAVAERFGIAHRTASLWISRARKLGYL